jgi:flagella basal body P-ring formation protein FlgA
VTEPEVRLGDIAHIESASIGDDEKIVQLRTISLGKSPRAGDSVVIEGGTILEQMRSTGIRLDSVLYSLPRQVRVTRAFREVSPDELQRALDSFLTKQEKHLDIKKIVMEQPVKIPTDSFGVEVVGLQATRPGHFGVDYRSVAGSDEVRFQMKALADEWRLMPVAAKPLKKGQVVSAADVQLNRIHGIAVAREMIEQLGDVVGKTLTRDVGQGEMFQAKAVTLPPVITAGSRVSMLYRHGRLEASAVGVALESGAAQQEIKVRNEDSQKTVTARVVDKGLVEVEAR